MLSFLGWALLTLCVAGMAYRMGRIDRRGEQAMVNQIVKLRAKAWVEAIERSLLSQEAGERAYDLMVRTKPDDHP